MNYIRAHYEPREGGPKSRALPRPTSKGSKGLKASILSRGSSGQYSWQNSSPLAVSSRAPAALG